jgi:hypothetical protein
LSSLVGNSEVSMSGKAATFGGRMMTSIADQVLKQFADNFADRVGALAAQRAGASVPAAAGGEAAPAAAARSRGSELNGLALLWAIFTGWLRGVLGKIKA